MRTRTKIGLGIGAFVLGLAGCSTDITIEENNDAITPWEEPYQNEDAYGSNDVLVDPFEEDVVSPEYDSTVKEDLTDPYQPETSKPNYDVQTNPQGNIAPIARACRDENRKSDGSCNALELKAGKFYVFNFSKKPDNEYFNEINPSAGDSPVPGHPTRSEDPDGEIAEYCVQWTENDGWICQKSETSFYQHFKSGEKGIISVAVKDTLGETSEIDSVEYSIK